MISASYILRSIDGALCFAMYDEGGTRYLDNSFEGFIRSFFVAILVVPIFLVLLNIELSNQTSSIGNTAYDSGSFYLVNFLIYFVGWAVYPLVMIPVSKFLEADKEYTLYIVAYNWSSIISYSVIALPLFLASRELIGDELQALMFFVCVIYAFSINWFIAFKILKVSGFTATSILILELTLSILLAQISDRLLGV